MTKKDIQNYEIDFAKYKDPLKLRRVYEAIAALHVGHPRVNLERLASAAEALPILVPRDHPYAEEIVSGFALLEELLTGKGLEIDPNTGEPMSADLLTEISDFFGALASGKDVKQYSGGADAEGP